jgi:hypothetical protein
LIQGIFGHVGIFRLPAWKLVCPAKRGPAHSNSVSGIRQKTWHTFSARERHLAGVADSTARHARTADEDFQAGIGAFSR